MASWVIYCRWRIAAREIRSTLERVASSDSCDEVKQIAASLLASVVRRERLGIYLSEPVEGGDRYSALAEILHPYSCKILMQSCDQATFGRNVFGPGGRFDLLAELVPNMIASAPSSGTAAGDDGMSQFFGGESVKTGSEEIKAQLKLVLRKWLTDVKSGIVPTHDAVDILSLGVSQQHFSN